MSFKFTSSDCNRAAADLNNSSNKIGGVTRYIWDTN
jgi:hypothetical protein